MYFARQIGSLIVSNYHFYEFSHATDFGYILHRVQTESYDKAKCLKFFAMPDSYHVENLRLANPLL
jgi:hypothetical protein